MKHYLLPKDLEYFKVNMHCHTVLSDGEKTPEEIKRDYKAHGYSAVAFTDHDKYIDHQDLTDDGFVALNGFELEYYREGFMWKGMTTHLCFVAKDPANSALGWSDPAQNCFAPSLAEGEHPLQTGGGLYKVLPCARAFSPEYINADIAAGKKMGFFVTYNHPTWSLERYPRYSAFEGMDAMEMVNYDCIQEAYEDDNGRVYNDLLELGRNIGCIATDDNHNAFPDGDPRSDSYGGCTMIGAEKLSYGGLIKGLENKLYYCRGIVNPNTDEAPYIRALWMENGHVFIETSPVRNIFFVRNTRPFVRAGAVPGETVSAAEFDPSGADWFRIVVISKGGNKAYTNAYFMEDFL